MSAQQLHSEDLYNKSGKNEKYSCLVFGYKACNVTEIPTKVNASLASINAGKTYHNPAAGEKTIEDVIINLSLFDGFTSRYPNI